MADIYGYSRNPKPAAVFSNELATLTIGGSFIGLVQNWSAEYAQDVQELFEIGSANVFWLKGRPVGRGAISRVVSGAGALIKGGGMETAYDVCQGGGTMTISGASGVCYTAEATPSNMGVDLTMSGVIVSSVGYSMTVADVRLAENFQWKFTSLSV